jgi:hypothetical protein
MTDWKDRLSQKFTKLKEKRRDDEAGLATSEELARLFYTTIAGPALEELTVELERHGCTVALRTSDHEASITVSYQGQEESRYSIETRVSPTGVTAHPKWSSSVGGQSYDSEGYFRKGIQNYSVLSITKDEIIEHFLHSYRPSA